MNIPARIGAIAYIIWGMLHIVAARKVYLLALTLEPGIVQGRVFQDAWNLLFFALFAIIVAIFLNWHNSKLGYWLNLVVISVADIGFIVTVIIPGFLPVFPALIGPLVWIIAVVSSTQGMLTNYYNPDSSVPFPKK